MNSPRKGDFIGYARVSTIDQDPALQLDALEKAGCVRTFVEKASGARAARPQLELAFDNLREGDTLVVWRLDRLGRSLRDLVSLVERLEAGRYGFKSLHESVDTGSPAGKLTFHIFSALAEFERELIRERTSAGLAAARRRGRTGGRPPVMTADKREIAIRMSQERTPAGEYRHTVAGIADALGVSRSTIYRALQA